MVKAELIEEPQETELVKIDNVPDMDVAIEQWDAYQKLCKGLLNDTDYQEIIVKEKDEEGNYVKVKRHFKKKSAWQKLSRAFNVDTAIVDRDLERTKTGRIKEAYYCVRQLYQTAEVLNQMHYVPVLKEERTKFQTTLSCQLPKHAQPIVQ